MNVNELPAELRKFVLIKSGLRNIDPGHCKVISEYVFQETKNYVSETTIKRFFGFANTMHKFSLFTLNSLSQYVGYPDWNAFCKDKESDTSVVKSIWQDLKLKTQAITDISLIAKKNNSGVPFTATSNRSFFYPDFDYFLKNNYQFTTITSQAGQGKSILLAHLVEHFFYTDQAVYKNDIVLLINSTTLGSIIQTDLSLNEWFKKEFKFHNIGELIHYFKQNPDKREGRFILIIDGIDEYLNNSHYFKTFIDILYGIEENNFFKVVLGLRSNTWNYLQPAISGSAFLTKSWYNGLFYSADGLNNMPPLNTEEILYTLSHIEGRNIAQQDICMQLLKQFKSPLWLQIYYKLKIENKQLELKNPLMCYEIVSYFLEKKIFMARKSTEKIFILKNISAAISPQNKNLTVSKEKILSYASCYPDAYEELVLSGILVEEKNQHTPIPTETVRFLNEDVYTYFIFIQITEKFNFEPDKDFFEYILVSFAKLESQKAHLLNWAIRFCISKNKIKPLRYIFKFPFTNEEKNNAFNFICGTARYELNRPGSSFNKQSIDLDFVDILALGKATGNMFKETIHEISQNVLNEDVQIFLHVIECSIYLLDVDKHGLSEVMKLLKRNYKRLGELFPINPYELIQYFYNHLIHKTDDSKTLDEKISNLCQQIDQSKPLVNDALSTAEILSYKLAVSTLYAKRNYADCHRFIMAILNKYPNIFYIRYSEFCPFLLVMLGKTYLKLHYYKKAQRINQFLDKIITDHYIYSTDYVRASYFLYRANFFNYTGNHTQALREIELGLELATTHDFKITEISFLLIKIDSLKSNDTTEEVSTVIKMLLNFLTSHKILMPDYANLNKVEFEHTFKILKSYKSIC